MSQSGGRWRSSGVSSSDAATDSGGGGGGGGGGALGRSDKKKHVEKTWRRPKVTELVTFGHLLCYLLVYLLKPGDGAGGGAAACCLPGVGGPARCAFFAAACVLFVISSIAWSSWSDSSGAETEPAIFFLVCFKMPMQVQLLRQWQAEVVYFSVVLQLLL